MHPIHLQFVCFESTLADFVKAFLRLNLLLLGEQVHHRLGAMLRHHQGSVMN
ncbi:MAG TPA: hypothetical protein VH592_13320 [Gemmataceae bacterium]|jgi:hypothetical protein